MKISKLNACAAHIIKNDPTFITFMNILTDHTNLAISRERYNLWLELCKTFYNKKRDKNVTEILIKCIGNYTGLFNIKVKDNSIDPEGGCLKCNPLYVMIISGERTKDEV